MSQPGNEQGQPGPPKWQPPPPLMQKESGNAVTNAVADIVNQSAQPFQGLSNPDASKLEKASAVVNGVMGLAQAPTAFLDDAFARLTNPIAQVFPCFPAAVMGMPVLGIPHEHTHPPAFPIPLPALGAILTSCPTVLISGLPAARSGDYGLGPTCGSVAPVFEICTGSSKVFIGGSRAARMLDFTRQCMPAPPPAALTKMQKIKEIAGMAAPFVAMGLGLAGAVEHASEAGDKADQAEAAADDASAEDAAAAQAKAQSAAAEAAGAALGAAMMGADMAMNAAQMAMGALMGKDPGAPPCIGVVMMGVPNVLVGGFPMPSWSDVAKGLKKLIAALKRGRRGGKAKGKAFCFGCM